jgi:hypothetical protein
MRRLFLFISKTGAVLVFQPRIIQDIIFYKPTVSKR